MSARVLVIDDDTRGLASTVAFLSANGISATGANGSDAALMAVQGQEFGLVLMDLAIPGDRLQGVALVRELRANGHRGKVVAYTGDQFGGQTRAMAAGCDGCIVKPVVPSGMLAAVKRYVGSE